jgi:hypothetical protein
MTSESAAPIGHNLPPVVVPSDESVRGDLEARYPEVKREIDEMEEALKTMPAVIESEDTAKALADNLGKIGKLRKSWKAFRADEKKPWNTVIGIIQNFFVNGEDKLQSWDEKWRPILKVWQDKKESEAAAARQQEIDRQQEEAERLRLKAEELKMDALYAEALKELAEFNEAAARKRLEDQERDRIAAEALAEEERNKQRALEEEKKRRDREERDRNTQTFRSIRASMKAAEKLHLLVEADEADDDEMAQLDEIIKPAGLLSTLTVPLNASLLLDDEQRTELDGVKTRLGEMRTGFEERSNKRERAKREKARLAEDAAARERAEDRMWSDAREELRLYDQRKAREAADAAVDTAKALERDTKGSIGEARTLGRSAYAGMKESARAVKDTTQQAERTENRVSRLEKRQETATGDGTVRGEYSAVSSQTGHWTANITDENALRAVCGPLGPHFTADALQGSVHQWMVAHRGSFEGERATDTALPGVVFIWERGLAIRA